MKDLFNLANQEKNDEIKEDCIKKIDEVFDLIKKSEIQCFLSGENDDLNIYLEVMQEQVVRESGLGRYA